MTEIKKRWMTIGCAVIFAITSLTSYASEKNVADETEYKVVLEKTGNIVKIVTQGKSGYHCNTLYPWKLTVEGKSEKKVYKKGDAKEFGEKRVVFAVPSKSGKAGTLKFSVCNDKQCVMKTVKVNL